MTNRTKYGKYIVTDYLTDEEKIARGRTPDKREEGVPFGNGLVWLDEKIVKDAFYMEVVLLEPGSKSSGVWVKPHTHDKDEIIGFIGTNVRNPRSLDAEIELWLGDEKHILTKTCLVFVPRGLEHCPLIFNRVGTPVVHFSVLTGGQYLWKFTGNEPQGNP
jgi:hypothetical protein